MCLWQLNIRPQFSIRLQELQADVERQQHVQANVPQIEARDREERAEVLRLQSSASHAANIPTPDGEHLRTKESQAATECEQKPSPQPQQVPQKENDLPKVATRTYL